MRGADRFGILLSQLLFDSTGFLGDHVPGVRCGFSFEQKNMCVDLDSIGPALSEGCAFQTPVLASEAGA